MRYLISSEDCQMIDALAESEQINDDELAEHLARYATGFAWGISMERDKGRLVVVFETKYNQVLGQRLMLGAVQRLIANLRQYTTNFSYAS